MLTILRNVLRRPEGRVWTILFVDNLVLLRRLEGRVC